ncbi:hypothetical protein HK414_14275 [Ramlibacter terrae]|uniref:Uncharacterized protein n=1 Tax=Ramlibacter terrae TaxID=2732511 RepID=A0ABX6P353_9BURK|nr:hypothetical protein HK414_14275 [Ramlibacter terrae]
MTCSPRCTACSPRARVTVERLHLLRFEPRRLPRRAGRRQHFLHALQAVLELRQRMPHLVRDRAGQRTGRAQLALGVDLVGVGLEQVAADHDQREGGQLRHQSIGTFGLGVVAQ